MELYQLLQLRFSDCTRASIFSEIDSDNSNASICDNNSHCPYSHKLSLKYMALTGFTVDARTSPANVDAEATS